MKSMDVNDHDILFPSNNEASVIGNDTIYIGEVVNIQINSGFLPDSFLLEFKFKS